MRDGFSRNRTDLPESFRDAFSCHSDRRRHHRGESHLAGGSTVNDLVQLSAIQPDAATFWAIVDLHPAAIGNHKGFVVYGATHRFLHLCTTAQMGRNARFTSGGATAAARKCPSDLAGGLPGRSRWFCQSANRAQRATLATSVWDLPLGVFPKPNSMLGEIKSV
jgi:hypothetical protein